jgi:hypothetical protein
MNNPYPTRELSFPPRLDPDFDYKAWAKDITKIVSEKASEILPELGRLESEYKDLVTRWDKMLVEGKLGEKEHWVLCFQAECKFARYFELDKTLKYWINLSEKVYTRPKDSLERQSDLDVESARSRRLEDYYLGDLRRVGNRLIGRCPFHEEDTPSFSIYSETNHYHCFGCQAHGDIIKFVMETKKLSFLEAVSYLK